MEVPAEYIFSYNVNEKLINMYSWTDYFGPEIFTLEDWINTQALQQSMPDDEFHFKFNNNMDLSDNVRNPFLTF